MGKYPEDLPTYQCTTGTPNQGRAGAHLNPDGGPIQAAPPEGKAIQILVQPAEIADGPPKGKDTKVAVWGLRMGWE